MFTIQSLGHGERYLKKIKLTGKHLTQIQLLDLFFCCCCSIINFGENGYEFELRYNTSEPQGEVLIQHWLKIWA